MNIKVVLIASLSLIVIFIIAILGLLLLIKSARLTLKHAKLAKYLYKYVNVITSVRYGNLNSKVEDGIDTLTCLLSKNTNALIESIKDRDMMINEYIEKEKQTQNIKQDFIASLAHDLKVPIIAQDNTYDLFLNGNFGKLSELQYSAIKNLKISNNDLKNLIIDLLDAQKLEEKEFELDIKNVSLNRLIEETIQQNQSILTLKDKIIYFEKPDEEIFYPLDSFLIKRVLNNLISNAVLYGKNSQNIYIKLNKTKAEIKISVIDEGDGIKEEDIKKIFSKYYSASKKYSNIGAGLGLYIANKIVLSHKGKLSAQNNKGKGANFSISLPLTNI